MSETKLLQKLRLYKKNPDLVKEPTVPEMVDLLLIVLQYMKETDKSVKDGVLKGDKGDEGYTPQADRDYMSLSMAKDKLNTFIEAAQQKIKDGVDGKDGRDGKDAVVSDAQIQEAAERAHKLIQLPDFDSLITQEPTAIRDALELLQGEERLNIEAIKGLQDTLNEIRDSAMRNVSLGGGGGVSKNFVVDYVADNAGGGGHTFETPTGTINGSNTTFTVANTPAYIIINGVTYFEGHGYELSDLTITTDFAPETDSWIRSAYSN